MDAATAERIRLEQSEGKRHVWQKFFDEKIKVSLRLNYDVKVRARFAPPSGPHNITGALRVKGVAIPFDEDVHSFPSDMLVTQIMLVTG